MSSVCDRCRWHTCQLVTTDPGWAGNQYEDDCEEGSDNFMTEDGCWHYEEYFEPEEDA